MGNLQVTVLVASWLIFYSASGSLPISILSSMSYNNEYARVAMRLLIGGMHIMSMSTHPINQAWYDFKLVLSPLVYAGI